MSSAYENYVRHWLKVTGLRPPDDRGFVPAREGDERPRGKPDSAFSEVEKAAPPRVRRRRVHFNREALGQFHELIASGLRGLEEARVTSLVRSLRSSRSMGAVRRPLGLYDGYDHPLGSTNSWENNVRLYEDDRGWQEPDC